MVDSLCCYGKTKGKKQLELVGSRQMGSGDTGLALLLPRI